MTVAEVTTPLKHYLAIWSESDAAKRTTAIPAVYAEDVQLVDPFFTASGRATLNGFIEELQQKYPGYAFGVARPIETHHDVAHLSWTFGPPAHPAEITGQDVAVLANGRIQLLCIFSDGASSQTVT